MHELNAKVVKMIGTKYPKLRTMIRNHPYTKVVGMGVVKCLLKDMKMRADAVSEELLKELLEKGIDLYHKEEERIKDFSVTEHKQQVIREALKDYAESRLAAG
ncbi:hypothetical protein [Hydrogenimonas sp. SS33]|uniref:hypothetical protein n=1 Tax=Hydrogenimonas leucolamina TaxID=2954236 RepID=UPI00336C1C05